MAISRGPSWRVGLIGLAWLQLALASAAAMAAPVVETSDRLEVNWSTLRIRFFGEARIGMDLSGDGFKGVEKAAWRDGVSYAYDAVRVLNISINAASNANQEQLADDAGQAARQFAQSIYSINTTYFGDGTVRVHLESSLPKVISPLGIHFRQKEAPEPGLTQYTGVVLHLDKAMKPRIAFQVVDEAGASLFELRDMAQEAFRRTLMGRWYRAPTAAELSESVGPSPIHLRVAVQEGRLVVERSQWDQALEGHKSLLVNGAIALALP